MTWAVILGISVPEIPRNDTFRTVFLAVVWYSFAISCIFQTYFTSILMNPGMNKQITTLEELYQSSFVYHYNSRTDSFVKFTDPLYYSEIHLKREKCLYRGSCIIDYLNNLNVAISSRFHAEYYTLAALPPGSPTQRMCTLKDSFYSIRYTIYIGKGSFLVDTFNRIIYHATEAGLIDKLMRDAKTCWRYEDVLFTQLATDEIFRMNNETAAYIVFSMSHLKVAFYLLALGYLLYCHHYSRTVYFQDTYIMSKMESTHLRHSYLSFSHLLSESQFCKTTVILKNSFLFVSWQSLLALPWHRGTNKSVIQNKLHYEINGLEWAEACMNRNTV